MATEEHKARALRASMASAKAMRERVALMPKWSCAHCGLEKPGTVHQRRQTYCSKQCMSDAYKGRMVGEANPNYRGAAISVCAGCGETFHAYQRAYCSRKCFNEHGVCRMRRACRRDANHQEIFEAMEKECKVCDLSHAGNGVPDGVAFINYQWRLFEIKNPKTNYGKGGLSPRQKQWVDKPGRAGGPVFILRTVEEATRFAKGDFDGIDFFCPDSTSFNLL